MPTNEWFKQNPKISAYIPVDLHHRLEAWMEANGVKKVSQALTQILGEYLGVSQSKLNLSTIESNRLEALEGK